MNDSSMILPTPPTGYQPAIHFEYPRLALQIGATVLVVVLLPVLFTLTWFLQGRIPLFRLGWVELGLVILTIMATVLIHEWVHGLAFQLLGYKVTYGASLRLLAAYAAAFGQFQRRNHNLLVALAPLVMLTTLLVPLLAVPHHFLLLIVFTALLFNASGAVADLYLSWRLLRLPPTALLYDVDPKTMLIFLPDEG